MTRESRPHLLEPQRARNPPDTDFTPRLLTRGAQAAQPETGTTPPSTVFLCP